MRNKRPGRKQPQHSQLSSSAKLAYLFQNPDLVRAEACRRSLFTFVKEFWSEIIPEEPVYNWHIPYLCRELEQCFRSVVNRREKEYDLIINIPPGTTKSTLCTVMFPAWAWIARNPENPGQTGADLRFMTGSYSSSLSMEHAELSRDIIWSDKWKRYFPDLEIRGDKAQKSNFKNNHMGTRFSTSVGSTATGVHAHFLLVDDPVDPKKALSDVERDAANRWMDHTLSTRKVDKRITVTILIMQRLHKGDPTGNMVEKSTKLRHIVLPASTEYDVKPPELKKFYRNGLLDPERLSMDVLKENKTKLGSYGYGGQFGQSPKPREGAMFQEEWFEIVDAAPAGGTEWVRGWDLAATTEQEAKNNEPAYTAGVKMKYVDGIFYIAHSSRFRKSPENVRRAIRALATQDEPGTIIDIPQDPGQAGKSQVRSFVRYLPEFEVRYSTESGDKVLRAEPISAQAEAGNIKLVRGPWNREYIDEITYFPNGFKDQVDATTRAYNRLVKLAQVGRGVVGPPAGIKNEKKEQL